MQEVENSCLTPGKKTTVDRGNGNCIGPEFIVFFLPFITEIGVISFLTRKIKPLSHSCMHRHMHTHLISGLQGLYTVQV